MAQSQVCPNAEGNPEGGDESFPSHIPEQPAVQGAVTSPSSWLSDLLTDLSAALSYVEKVASTAPTTPSRIERQRDAIRLVAQIKTTLAKAGL